jgi:hypothetical protein
MNKNERAKATQ